MSMCLSDLSWLNHLPIQGVCLCVCNQWAYADNCTNVVDQLLINIYIYIPYVRDLNTPLMGQSGLRLCQDVGYQNFPIPITFRDPAIMLSYKGECRTIECPMICPANYDPICGSDSHFLARDTVRWSFKSLSVFMAKYL